MDYYNVKPQIFAEMYKSKVERFSKKLKHLKYELNFTNEDVSHSLGFTFIIMMLEVEPLKWYVDNYEVGGMLDSYDDRRTKYYKSLKTFCENNFQS